MVDEDKTFVERRVSFDLRDACSTRWQGNYHSPTNFMKRYLIILTLAAGLSVSGASCSLLTTKQVNSNTTNTNIATTGAITYAGQDGKNALELLQQKHSVDVSAQGFVNAIDGRKPGDHEFWALYVNGKQAEVGAKEYVSKSNDAIEWKLESF